MNPETKLIVGRIGAALLGLFLLTLSMLVYQEINAGLFDETAHRLATSFNEYSGSLAQR
ncbi:hypothetical protein [Robiginitalea sp. IMCC43444]|uniref:hypothetical protein n=1 Tax=Robiginitalea sp. IMCC43444 TaxID=3459121 RepID=UPI004041DED5